MGTLLSTMDCVSQHSVVQITAILPVTRWANMFSSSLFPLRSFYTPSRVILWSISSDQMLVFIHTDIRPHTSECNPTVNCHTTNSKLFLILTSSQWPIRQDSTLCLECEIPRSRAYTGAYVYSISKSRIHSHASLHCISYRSISPPCLWQVIAADTGDLRWHHRWGSDQVVVHSRVITRIIELKRFSFLNIRVRTWYHYTLSS
jgi:hypothetical protein